MDEVHGSHREKKEKKTHICIQAIMWITKGEAERLLTSTPHTPTPTSLAAMLVILQKNPKDIHIFKTLK